MKFKIGIILSSIIFASSVNASEFLHPDKGDSSSISISNIKVKSQSNKGFMKDNIIPTIYNLRVFKILSNDSLIDSSGIYNTNSPLLDVNGELLVYGIGLSQIKIEKLKDIKIDGGNIQIPKVKNLDSDISKLPLSQGKIARFNSPKYSINGKEYQNVYLLSLFL